MMPGANIYYSKADKKLHVDLFFEKTQLIKADVYDCCGKCVEHVMYTKCKAGNFNTALKVNNIHDGMYFFRITNSDNECNVIRFSVN